MIYSRGKSMWARPKENPEEELCGEITGAAAGEGEGNTRGSEVAIYLPPKSGKQRLIARFYYNIYKNKGGTMEIWKDIVGYEGKYQVSNYGQVRALHYRMTDKTRLINIRDNKGYCEVALWKNSSRKLYMVHRLVAETFIPNPNCLPQVNHKDENKKNNRVDNLEWCTQAYNNMYGTRIDRVKRSLNTAE